MFKSCAYRLMAQAARAALARYKPRVIGVTGSVGKTSAKEAIAAVLAAKYSVRKSPKNYNTELGVPLTILGISQPPGSSLLRWFFVMRRALALLWGRDTSYPALLVLEMGADKPGDIAQLLKIAPCAVGVLTAIAPAHTQFFGDLDGVAREKRRIIAHLGKHGTAVINYDNDRALEERSATSAAIVTYGCKNGADLQASDIKTLYDATGLPTGLNFKVNVKGSSVPVFLPGHIGENSISAALAGLAVGSIFGINAVDAAAALRHYVPLPGRMRLVPGIKRTIIIDDSYNASPLSMLAALKTLEQLELPPGKQRYAVLGDMLELGQYTSAAHREVGFAVAEAGVDYLITVGEAAKEIAAAAREAGVPEHSTASFADSGAAGKFLQEKLSASDAVLVKGSRAMHLETVVKEVMAEPLAAPQILVA